ncbi:NADH-quinone oxidoreductase subunit NuoG [Marinobacteraceae bacterium S3BR75-40.1]
MATLYVDNQPVEVDPDTNVLQACLERGFDLPYFCWHPAMGSVGSCRQCAVTQYKDENDTEGKLVMACMTPAADGTRIGLQDAQSREFRASVIEWMMTNHPHDCPVCEEGGECHLQDMTVMTGHNYRRFRFGKRTFCNQDLGPFLNHEMNRCITCYRCVRFYNSYCGGDDLHEQAQSNRVYFGRFEDGPLENEFSGNLAEVCPTGVFTDKTLGDRYSRKWDLRTAPSVCQHCAVGCNTSPGERYGLLKRVQNRYHPQINGYFLCDRGRFGYDYVNHEHRIRRPLTRGRRDAPLEPIPLDELMPRLAKRTESTALIGIGSPRASLETNFALQRLVGRGRFFTGMDRQEQQLVEQVQGILTEGRVRTPSVREMEEADAVVILGEDLTQTSPRIALSLRQAARNASFREAERQQVPLWQDDTVRELAQQVTTPIISLTPHATRLDDIATECRHGPVETLARVGHAMAHALDPQAPGPEDLDSHEREWVARVAGQLRAARRPLVVSGTGCRSAALLEAAANLAWALAAGESEDQETGLAFALPEANSLGVALLGGGSVEEALERLDEERCTLIVAENDLFQRAPESRVREVLGHCYQVILLDALAQPMVELADTVLPAGTFAEADGTLISSEGRAQRFFQVFEPDSAVQESWRWLEALGAGLRMQDQLGWKNLDDIIADCERHHPQLAGIAEAAPGADYRVHGRVAAREPHRYSGRTAMNADRDIHEQRPHRDVDAPMAFTMEGYRGPGRTPPALIASTWSPGWNSVQSLNRFQEEIAGPLRGGEPGTRLLHPGDGRDYFRALPAAPEAVHGKVRVMPGYTLFGSEELSRWSAPIRQRMPAAYLGIGPEQLDDHGAREGDGIELEMDGEHFTLEIRTLPGLTRGTVVLPVGLAVPAFRLPGWGTLHWTTDAVR